jgi:hypothetical protein
MKVLTRAARTLIVAAVRLSVTDCVPKSIQSPTDQQPQTPVGSFVGCYELSVGRWWPWGFSDETGYFRPPHRVQLLGELGRKGWEQNGLLLRSVPDSGSTKRVRGGPSYWNLISPTRIELHWTDGFTGIVIKLVKHKTELRGTVHPRSDAPMIIRRWAYVTAKPISCPVDADHQ